MGCCMVRLEGMAYTSHLERIAQLATYRTQRHCSDSAPGDEECLIST